MSKCVGIFGRLFGHKFVGRYSRSRSQRDPNQWVNVTFTGFTADEIDRLYRDKSTYHGDVCQRCGEIRNAPKEPKP